MQIKCILAVLLILPTICLGQSVTGPQHSSSPLNVTDGSTSCYPYSIAVSSGSLACSNGVATVTTGGGSGGSGSVGIGTANLATVYVGVSTVGPANNVVILPGGNVGIGTITPSALLNINTSNAVDLFRIDDSAGADATPFIIDQTGNVGIGSPNPSAVLAISSTLNQTLVRVDDNGTGDLSPFIIDANGNVGIGTTNTERDALLVMSGNVGIGTWVPSTKLDVSGVIVATGINTTTGNVGVGTLAPSQKLRVVSDDNTSTTNIAAFYANNFTQGVQIGFQNVKQLGATQPLYIDAGTSGVVAINSLLSSGNVGIGTVTPGTALDVHGNDVRIGLNARSFIRQTTSGDTEMGGNTGSAYTGLWIGGAEKARLNASGNLGIGSTAPGQVLDVQGVVRASSGSVSAPAFVVGSGVNNDTGIYSSATDTIDFSNAGAQSISINASGNVGISTNRPQSRLDVTGSDSGTTLTSASAARAVINNTNTTANNFADLAFCTTTSTGAQKCPTKIAGVFKSHTNASESGDLTFFTTTGGTTVERMRITSDGNVGIGSFSPLNSLQGLEVYDPVNASIGIRSGSLSGNATLDFGNPSSSTQGRIQYVTSTDTMILKTGGANQVWISSSGNVGIGSLGPQAKLDLGTSGTIVSHSTTGVGITIKTGANTACNTTCGTSACFVGFDNGTVGVANSQPVDCTDATADRCQCLGP